MASARRNDEASEVIRARTRSPGRQWRTKTTRAVGHPGHASSAGGDGAHLEFEDVVRRGRDGGPCPVLSTTRVDDRTGSSPGTSVPTTGPSRDEADNLALRLHQARTFSIGA